MSQLNANQRVVATLCLDEQNQIVKVLDGNACLRAHHPGEFKTFDYVSVLITESMLMDMNAMMRKRWESAARDITLAQRKGEYPYPRNIDVSF